MRRTDWEKVKADPEKKANHDARKRRRHAQRMEKDSEYREKVQIKAKQALVRRDRLPEEERRVQVHKWRLSSLYGLTPEDYGEMLGEQKGGCSICGTKEPGGARKVFAVDHCHKTGKIRGLLCAVCNLGLGKFKDSPELLYAAIQYLEDAKDKPLPAEMEHTVTCDSCGDRWRAKNIKVKLCVGCQEKHNQELEEKWRMRRKNCGVCAEEFVDRTQANNRKYCSDRCRDRRRSPVETL